jgi:hypothetical protein
MNKDKDIEELGVLCDTFRPKIANICAGSILGLALIVGGISFAVFFTQRRDPRPLDTKDQIAKYVLIGVIGVGAPIGGIALLAWMKRLASHRVTVHENGFSFVYTGSTEICKWEELVKINEVFTQEQLKVLKIPGAVIKNIDRSFVLCRKDGKDFNFDVNSIDNIPRFAECLKEVSDKHGITWERVEQ